jgi:hypothetical protein
VPSAGIHPQIFNSTMTQIAPPGAALRGRQTEIKYWMDK